MSTSRIKLLSGGFVDFLDIPKSQFTIGDIAHNLSRVCRFTGAVEKFYSVAQHSVLVSYAVEKEHALAALMHDASEAFTSDLNSPLKALIPRYKEIELEVEEEIFKRFGLPFPMHPSIKAVDTAILQAENYYLRGISNKLGPHFKPIKAWTMDKSKKEFLKRFEELTEGK